YPTFGYLDPAVANSAITPAQFFMSGYNTSFDYTKGTDFGGNIDLLRTFMIGSNQSELKFGVRYRAQNKTYTQNEPSYDANTALTMDQYLSNFSDPSFYTKLSSSYPLGPVPDYNATKAYQNANPGAFDVTTDTLGDLAASFSGDEKILAGYVMDNLYMGDLLINLGLRFEQTKVDYSANALATDTLGNTTASPVNGTPSSADWFPAFQLRYG